jgi:hypothetical protein
LSNTNTGDQTLPTDFVSATNGGTFGGAVTMGSLTSTGIDDNADQTVLTLGSDESATFAGNIDVTDKIYIAGKNSFDVSNDGLYIGSTTGANKNTTLQLRTNDTPAIDIDSSQSATFAGAVKVEGDFTSSSTNAYNNHTFEAYHAGVGTNSLVFRKSNHASNIVETDDNQVLGMIHFQGVDTVASGFVDSASIIARQQGDSASGRAPASLSLSASSQTAFHTSQLVLHQGGDVEVHGGNLTIGTAGKGISFSSTQIPAQSAGSGSSNLLDDYEEGTFNILYKTGGGGSGEDSVTTHGSLDTMSYTKIGRVVYITGRTNISAIDSPTGGLTLTGLPFTVTALTEDAERSFFTIHMGGAGLDSTANVIQGSVDSGGTTMAITEFTGTSAGHLAEKLGADTDIGISGCYVTA